MLVTWIHLIPNSSVISICVLWCFKICAYPILEYTWSQIVFKLSPEVWYSLSSECSVVCM
jgi:hypothetical protein